MRHPSVADHKWLFFPTTILFLIIDPDPAAAHTYYEHFRITASAISLLKVQTPNRTAHFGDLSEFMHGTSLLCPGEAVLGSPPLPSCFTAPDLSALAGDHAASPAILSHRWFGSSKGTDHNWLAKNLTEAVLTENATSPAEECELNQPNVAKFLELARQDPDKRKAFSSDFDRTAIRIDGQYICLAQHNEDHFRLPTIDIHSAASVHTPNVIASYARYHGQAKIFASLSRLNKRLAGAAIFYELFALHFLQDSIAPGHMVTPRTLVQPATARATHDYWNAEGLKVTIPVGVCLFAWSTQNGKLLLPALFAACEKARRPKAFVEARIVGDGNLFGKASRDKPQDAAISVDLAILLSSQSLSEVLAELDSPSANYSQLNQCQTVVAKCTDYNMFERPDLACFTAWRNGECEDERPELRETRLLDLLPSPAEPTPIKEFYAGFGEYMGFRPRLALSRQDGHFALFPIAAGVAYFLPPQNHIQLSGELGATYFFSDSAVGMGGDTSLNLRIAQIIGIGVGGLLEYQGWFWDRNVFQKGAFGQLTFSRGESDNLFVAFRFRYGYCWPSLYGGWFVGLEVTPYFRQ